MDGDHSPDAFDRMEYRHRELVSPREHHREDEAREADAAKQLEARVREAGISNVRCEQADLYALRFDAGSFDAVFAANVLHLVPDLERALANLRRMLQPGGVLVAPTYLHKETLGASMLSRVFALTGFPGQRRFTSTTLRAAIEAAGFAVTRTEIIPGPFPIGYIEAAAPLTS